MDNQRMPKPGEIYNHFKDKLYQIITIATNTETDEPMVVYQALYGDFKAYVRPLTEFVGEVDKVKYPEAKQKYKYELRKTQEEQLVVIPIEKKDDKDDAPTASKQVNLTMMDAVSVSQVPVMDEKLKTPVNEAIQASTSEMGVNALLMRFLDAESYNKKLEILTSNIKHLDDRLINDMAVALDCAVDEGPIDQRIQGLIYCLQAMCRFEDRRLR